MTAILLKLFVKQTDPAEARVQCGVLSGMTGIVMNLFLFAFKLLMGFLSGAVSVMADAFNNLSDAGSSVVTLIGIKLAAKPADPDHPFGHGRFEYLASLLISAIIFIVGGSFFMTSVEKIFSPETVNASPVVFAVLLASMAIKLWLSRFNKQIGTKIDSSAVLAAGQDSLNDVFVTAATLVSMAATLWFDLTIDGIIGVGVSLFILKSAWDIAKDTVDTLLGAPADPEICAAITERVLKYDCVYSIHDLIVHNYGPGRTMASVHAEVPADYDILKAHDAIDLIERTVKEEMGIPLVIHLDPVDLTSEDVVKLRLAVTKYVRDINSSLNVHDFRMVKGDTHTNLIFDINVPMDCPLSDADIKSKLDNRIAADYSETYYTVITFDRAFI